MDRMNEIKRAGLGWCSGVATMCFGLRLQDYLGCDVVVRAPDGYAVLVDAVMAAGLFAYAASRKAKNTWTM